MNIEINKTIEKNPAKSGVLAFITKYSQIWLVLICMAMNYIIRNPPTEFYKHGLFMAWLAWGLTLFKGENIRIKTFGLLFCCLAIYTEIDNLIYINRHFQTNDLVMIAFSILIATSYAIYHKARFINDPIRAWEPVKILLIITIAFFKIAGRNFLDYYFPVFAQFGWVLDGTAGVFYRTDGMALVLAGVYFIIANRGITMVVGITFLLLNLSNYIDEMAFDPLHDTISEWIINIYILLLGAWLVVWYKVRKNEKHLKIMINLAIIFHAYLITGIVSLYIYFLSNATAIIKISSILAFLAITSLSLRKFLKRIPE